MKKIICLLVMFFGLSSYAQISYCNSDAILQNEIGNNPLVKEQLDIMNERIRQSKKIKDKKDKYSAPTIGTMTIPVVVYIVHNGEPLGESTNISDIQVAAQIEVLNNRFEQHAIKFCLAKKADVGTWATQNKVPYNSATEVQNTPGIIHINNPDLSQHTSSADEIQALLNTANNLVSPQKYLRIWVVKSIDGFQPNLLGYAWIPNGSSYNRDGIVILSDVFGSNSVGNLMPNYNQGEVLVHEVGHYLGLYHTFEGGCVTSDNGPLIDGDRIDDTPKVAEANFYCIPNTDSCLDSEGPDKIHNYMDYGDNFCTESFTPGQVERMRDEINIFRNELVSSDNIIYTGTCGSKDSVSAKITPSKYTVCAIENSILFEALSSTGEPWTYSWNFGDLASSQNISSSQNPTHTFTNAVNSPYTVTLTVTGVTNEGVVTVSNSIKIFVTDCHDIRNSETNWYLGSINNPITGNTLGSRSLSFSTGIPEFNQSIPVENYCMGSAIESNSDGSLLMYTNGETIWDSNHQEVNTEPSVGTVTGLMDDVNLIVKVPDINNDKYYIFRLDQDPDDVITIGLRYSTVTVEDSNITIGDQNKPITLTNEFGMSSSNGFDTSTFDEAVIAITTITAIKNCDGYWILTRLSKGFDQFIVVFTLNNNGLRYHSEYLIPYLNTITNVPRKIKVSPNGNKICCYNEVGGLGSNNLIVDFNKVNGKIDNPKNFIIEYGYEYYNHAYGCSFSPDSQLLYISSSISGISQYNINSRNISASKKIVGNNEWRNRQLRLGPDNKIYLGVGGSDKLSVIHNPNKLVTTTEINACNFSKDGPKILDNNNKLISGYLPNFIDAKKETAYFSSGPEVISAYLEGCNRYRFFPNYDNSANCNFTFKWVINHTTDLTIPEATYSEETPFHQFNASAPGVYLITLYYNSIPVGTMNITVAAIVPPTITGSVAACETGENTVTSNSVPLSALSAGQTVFWEVTGGSGTTGISNTDSNVNVLWDDLPGEIKVTVTDVNGCPASSTRTIDRICCDCLENLLWEATVPSNGLARDFILNAPGTTGCSGYNLKYNWYQKNGVILINTTGYSDYYDATQSIQSPIKPGGVRVDVLNSNGNVTCSRTFGIFPANRLINSDSENQKYYPQVYPNPSNGIYNIRIENFTGKIAFQIFDLNGRLIFDINDDQFENERAIDLRNLQSGIYIIKIIGNEINYSHKLIKN